MHIWSTVACHLDRTEKRRILEFLAISPARVPVEKLRAYTFGDPLLLESLLNELTNAGLLNRTHRPDGRYVGLSRTPGLRETIRQLPDYYARLQRRPGFRGKPWR